MRINLTDQQLAFFNTFGYLVIRRLLSPTEVERVTAAFEWSIQNYGRGRDHDGTGRTMFGGPIEHTPELCALMDHAGILGLIGGVIGKDFNYCGGDGNYYTGDTNWHPDGNWGRLWGTKTAFYLDELRHHTGCLRVIPGSHHPDHFVRSQGIDPNESEVILGVPPADFPGGIALETDPGDVVIFNHDLYHAAYGGSDRRRMFTMNCIPRAKTPRELDLARKYISIHSPGARNIDKGAGMYFPTMLDTANKKRMDHLLQPAEIHDQLFPQFARSIGDQETCRSKMK